MKLFVTPDEFRQIKDAELECYDWNGNWNDWRWYGKVKAILGGRCPEPYTGPHDLVVIWDDGLNIGYEKIRDLAAR